MRKRGVRSRSASPIANFMTGRPFATAISTGVDLSSPAFELALIAYGPAVAHQGVMADARLFTGRGLGGKEQEARQKCGRWLQSRSLRFGRCAL